MQSLVSTVGADRDSYDKDRGRAGNSRPPCSITPLGASKLQEDDTCQFLGAGWVG